MSVAPTLGTEGGDRPSSTAIAPPAAKTRDVVRGGGDQHRSSSDEDRAEYDDGHGEEDLPAEFDAAGYGALSTFTGALADQVPLLAGPSQLAARLSQFDCVGLIAGSVS